MNNLASTAPTIANIFTFIQDHVNGTIFENAFMFSLATLSLTFVVAYIVRVFFRVVIKYILSYTKVDVDDEIAKTVQKPVFSTVLFGGFTLLLYPFFGNSDVWAVIIKVIITLILTHWTFASVRVMRVIFTFLSRLKRVQLIKRETLPVFYNLSAILIFIFAFYFVLAMVWKIDMTALIASLGVAGIAIGFAAKDTLANLFSGVFILSDQPYKIGDYIVLGTGERGEVVAIGIRSTRILTRDDVEITIPNSIMGNTSVTNESGGPYKKTRITTNVGVAYGSDIDKVRKILMDIAEENEDVQRKPEPRVRVRGFGPSSVDFALLTWVKEPAYRGKTLDALYTEIYKAFGKHGIEIPYQKQDVYIKEFPGKRA